MMKDCCKLCKCMDLISINDQAIKSIEREVHVSCIRLKTQVVNLTRLKKM